MSEKQGNSLYKDAFKRLFKNKAALISTIIIVVTTFIAVFAEWISPFSFTKQDVGNMYQSFGYPHLLGTDGLGRDMLSRLIHGAQVSMAVGFFTSIVSLVMGIIYGAISGWFGGWVDSLMMRFVDLIYAIPTLVLLILVMVIFNSFDVFEDPKYKALTGIFLALTVVGWVGVARLVRGQVLQTKEMLYVEAAQSIGVGSFSIILRHILPNILGPIIVTLTFQIPANILFESFLSFIGLGLQPPYSSWGVLANDGWRAIRTYPHLIISPGVALYIVILSFNLLGDGLRDAFDPQLKNR
ncbi:MAG: ABC transporter permease [Bdellovibrionales bacterium]|nr:ABC transporter permease [Bdellovibrionales bacterium]